MKWHFGGTRVLRAFSYFLYFFPFPASISFLSFFPSRIYNISFWQLMIWNSLEDKRAYVRTYVRIWPSFLFLSFSLSLLTYLYMVRSRRGEEREEKLQKRKQTMSALRTISDIVFFCTFAFTLLRLLVHLAHSNCRRRRQLSTYVWQYLLACLLTWVDR